MKISFDRKTIVNKFLDPIMHLTDQCVVNVTNNQVYALTNDESVTTILYATLKAKNKLQKDLQLNIPSVRRLYYVFNCLTEDKIDLKIDTNNISYDTNDIKFKYHLLEDGVIQKNVINVDKIKKLKFDFNFVLTAAKLNEILKGSMFAQDSEKLYFYVENGKVYSKLTDASVQNMDSLSLFITDTFTGTALTQELPIKLDVFRTFNSKSDIVVKVNTKLKVLLFEISDTKSTLKYIVSALVK